MAMPCSKQGETPAGPPRPRVAGANRAPESDFAFEVHDIGGELVSRLERLGIEVKKSTDDPEELH